MNNVDKIAQEIRKQKNHMFGERDNLQQAFDYANSLSKVATNYAETTTAIMVYHNSLCEALAQMIEDEQRQ
jgi:hypothetical protein